MFFLDGILPLLAALRVMGRSTRPFYNGNNMDPKEAELLTVGVVAGDHSFGEIVGRIREHMVRE